MKRKNKGITLISLVITVVVLLILAAVTLNLTIGHNGIFSRAQEAKTSYEKQSLLEEMRLAMLDKKLEKGADLTSKDVEDALEKFGEVQKDEDGTVTGVKPNGAGDDEVITFEEIENGDTIAGETGESGGSTGQNSAITNAELAALKGKVDNLESTQESNSASIAALEAQIQALKDSLAASGDTNEKVAGLEAQLADLKSKVELQQSASESRLTSLESRLTKAEQVADVSSMLNRMYPVGSIFTSTNLDTADKVKNALGGGTWQAYGRRKDTSRCRRWI